MAENAPAFLPEKNRITERTGGGFDHSRGGHVFDLSGGVEPFMVLCKSPDGLANAVGLLRAASGDSRTAGFEKAVYVIRVADDPITKIGISADPIKRVADLQAAHYRELFLHAVIFTRKSMTIEQEVLRLASENGNRLLGEWIAEEPDIVLRTALEVARDKKIDVCDGRTWFDNRVTRTKSLYKYRKEMDGLLRRKLIAGKHARAA